MSDDQEPEKMGHPIRVVSQRTGLSVHTIRVWEKRYGAVTPARTSTNRRVYSDEDIERLKLLRQATLTGRSIGQVAGLKTAALRALMAEDVAALPVAPAVFEGQTNGTSPTACLADALEAAEQLDAQGLQRTLNRAAAGFSRPVLIDQVVVPLMHKIGDRWRDGSLRVAHEHLASAVVRTLLGGMEMGSQTSGSASRLIVATPSGQLHEIGALIVAVTAASEGWQVTYLGPNLPADEIVGAAHQNHARAVALSIVYPSDDPRVSEELLRLRRLMSPETAVLVGGSTCESYAPALDAIGAVRLHDMLAFRNHLELLRVNSG